MEFDRKTIIAFVLIGLILILINTEFYQRLMFGELPRPQPADSLATKHESMVSEREPLRSGRTGEIETAESLKAPIDFSYERNQARHIQISTPLYSATFSTLGATPISWQFKKYSDAEGNPVTLFKDGQNNLAIHLPMAEDTLNTGTLNFRWENAYPFGDTIHLEPGQTYELVFSRELVPGKSLRKIFTFSGSEYAYRFKIEFVGLQDLIQGYSYLLSWQTPLESTEQSIAEDMSYTKAYALANKELEEFDIGSKAYASAGNNDWATSWVAIRTKYFTVAAIPEGEQGTGVRFVGRTSKGMRGVEHKAYQMYLAMPLYREGQSGHSFTVYTGPLDYKIVKSLGVELERMMNLGWKVIQPFSIMILWMFTFLHNFIPNYGVVIIVFSILVKIVLHPLTKKSYQSMKEMQELQPQMTALREKYSNDPQKMNAEIMRLYKEHGVNPLGGCLPMLLQMPLLYALFIV
ncbi:MAG: membrane protein insertase YidC, partial [candidate division KSB1 bacterium]|nr:membrane protein insertase YidC [candidate division KSB1 bacterium]